MMSWIINAEIWVICWRLRQTKQTEGLIIYDIMRKLNSIIFLLSTISAADIELSRQLHMLLYIDCMLSTNQSILSKSTV